jgi:hypothetical protein
MPQERVVGDIGSGVTRDIVWGSVIALACLAFAIYVLIPPLI